MDNENIKKQALQLSEKDRAELAKRLLISLEDKVDDDIEQAWIAEINRRKKEIDSGEVELIPEEEVLAEARNIFKK